MAGAFFRILQSWFRINLCLCQSRPRIPHADLSLPLVCIGVIQAAWANNRSPPRLGHSIATRQWPVWVIFDVPCACRTGLVKPNDRTCGAIKCQPQGPPGYLSFGRRKRVVANGVSIGRKPTLTIIGNKRRYRALIPARGLCKKVILTELEFADFMPRSRALP